MFVGGVLQVQESADSKAILRLLLVYLLDRIEGLLGDFHIFFGFLNDTFDCVLDEAGIHSIHSWRCILVHFCDESNLASGTE